MISYIAVLLCKIRFRLRCCDCARVRLSVNAGSAKTISRRAPANTSSHASALASEMELQSSRTTNAKQQR